VEMPAAVRCADCGRPATSLEPRFNLQGGPICEDCWADRYGECEDCGKRLLLRDAAWESDDEPHALCGACYSQYCDCAAGCETLLRRDEAEQVAGAHYHPGCRPDAEAED